MTFDIILGNPPYQSDSTGDGANGLSRIALYDKFVLRAIQLGAGIVLMIIPARWLSQTPNSDANVFRETIQDNLRELVLYMNSYNIFPDVKIHGGICYFVWEDVFKGGKCKFTEHIKSETSIEHRKLRIPGLSGIARFNHTDSILKKMIPYQDESIQYLVSYRQPFGLESTYKGHQGIGQEPGEHRLYITHGISSINRDEIPSGAEYLDRYKVFISKACDGIKDYPYTVLTKPIIGYPGDCCTETYLVIGPFSTLQECESLASYIRTKFFRFLVLMNKPTQNTTQLSYSLVPMQIFDHTFSDDELYKKYNIDLTEQALIEKLIKGQA